MITGERTGDKNKNYAVEAFKSIKEAIQWMDFESEDAKMKYIANELDQFSYDDLREIAKYIFSQQTK